MFRSLEPLPADAILGMMALFRADPDPRKIDLSVGVYQNEQGHTPILESVKRAERAVLDAEDTKTYVAIAGNADREVRREIRIGGVERAAADHLRPEEIEEIDRDLAHSHHRGRSAFNRNACGLLVSRWLASRTHVRDLALGLESRDQIGS